MEQHSVPPAWLEVLGWISLVLAFASLLFIMYDIYGNEYRQKMRIMETVYPVTALYFGPAAVWFYFKYGRKNTRKYVVHHRQQQELEDNDVNWHQTTEAVTHCGAGCTLGDIVGEWLVFAFGVTIAGKALLAGYVIDFVLAWLLGVLFQYFTIVPMRNLSKLEGIWQAVKADTLSIIAFQVGLFAGMFVYQELMFAHPLSKATASYWLLMQLSMVLGFFTAYPVNKWLLQTGIKEKM